MKIKYLLIALLGGGLLQGCSPEFGSQEWCESMKDKPQSEWTPKDSMAFIQSCKVSDLMGK